MTASPRDAGRLAAVFVRPAENERRSLDTAVLTPERGLEGDRWYAERQVLLDDGSPNPCNQVSLMNVRVLRQIAGGEGAMHLAGDNLLLDLDLSEENLPAGSRLAIGRDVVLELTPMPHTGCSKFARRYGSDAREFFNTPRGKSLHLRGRYARVLSGGTINVGDMARRHPAM